MRTLELDDAQALLDSWGDPEVMWFMSSDALADEAAARDFIADVHRLTRERSLFQWGIERLEDRRLVGTCTLAGLDFANKRCEVGFAVARSCWGQGLLSDVLPALIDHAFNDLEFHRLDADVDPENAASLHILQKFGFQREGYLRECYQLKGQIQDAVLLGLLAPDWRRMRASASP